LFNINQVVEKTLPVTKEAIAELFDEIEVAYFITDGFDPISYQTQVGKELLPVKFQMIFEFGAFRCVFKEQILENALSRI
jgi:hypothetical protein